MIDTSDEAIAADLERAARSGTPGQISVWVAWAQIRAQLRQTPTPAPSGRQPLQPLPPAGGAPDIQIAVGPSGDSYAVPTEASWEDRVTAAARMLQLDADELTRRLGHGFVPVVLPGDDAPEGLSKFPDVREPVIEAPADLELNIDEDDIDDDFFRNEREARDR